MFLLYNLDQKLQILGIKGHKIKMIGIILHPENKEQTGYSEKTASLGSMRIYRIIVLWSSRYSVINYTRACRQRQD